MRGRPYADTCCPDCNGTGDIETVTVNGWGSGFVTCHGCGGEGSI